MNEELRTTWRNVPREEIEAAAARDAANSTWSSRYGATAYKTELLLRGDYQSAYFGDGRSSALVDRLKIDVAADFGELVTIQDTGINMLPFIALEATERGIVVDRLARGLPEFDPHERAELEWEFRNRVRKLYGSRSDAVMNKTAEFVAGLPALARRLAVGRLRVDARVMLPIVAHVARLNRIAVDSSSRPPRSGGSGD